MVLGMKRESSPTRVRTRYWYRPERRKISFRFSLWREWFRGRKKYRGGVLIISITFYFLPLVGEVATTTSFPRFRKRHRFRNSIRREVTSDGEIQTEAKTMTRAILLRALTKKKLVLSNAHRFISITNLSRCVCPFLLNLFFFFFVFQEHRFAAIINHTLSFFQRKIESCELYQPV